LICASSVGCQFNLANKRRQGGKEVRNSDLLINRDAGMGGMKRKGLYAKCRWRLKHAPALWNQGSYGEFAEQAILSDTT
jgi:hypothetical protein